MERVMVTPGFLVNSQHTFDTVDQKVAEAEFFLQQLFLCGEFEFACYFSAYLSASRTVTLALQRFFHIEGFEEWYERKRIALKNDELAKLFLRLRNDHVHGGRYPISGAVIQKGKSVHYLREGKNMHVADLALSARDHFLKILQIIYDAYVNFGPAIDPQQYFTKEHFATMGGDIDQAECEVWGWVCEHLIEEGLEEDDRWYELRAKADECHINYLFYSYLGKPTPQPELPDYLEEVEYTPEERGWVHTPAGYEEPSSADETSG